MSQSDNSRSKSETPDAERSSFVTVRRNGGWYTDIPAMVRSPGYQRQIEAVERLIEQGHFKKKDMA